MILCLDIGNTQIFGGIFSKNTLKLRFRHNSQPGYSSDQYGIFLKSVLRENYINVENIKQIVFCSVVPNIDYSLIAACKKYFHIDPFELKAGVKTGLKIKYNNPLEVGTDRIANAIAAIEQFANKDLIIIDFGTATTLCAISKNKEYLGGVILAGIRLSMDALQCNAAKLSPVEIIKPNSIIGRSTTASIQSGLYYGQLAAIKEITKKLSAENFHTTKPIIIGTGGFAHLFANEQFFSIIIPDLVLHGLRITLQTNIQQTTKYTEYEI
jgi:type III pantothenate kinase